MKKSTLNMTPRFNVAYRGKMFEILTWEGKPGVMFEAAARSPGVRLVIETEKNGMKALLMTKELRREFEGFDYRLPGGKVFDTLAELDNHRISGKEVSDLALNAARKEGKEEAGIIGGDYSSIEISKAGASIEWDLHYYLVTKADLGEQVLDEQEIGDIETVILCADEIYDLLCSRKIKEGRSADILWSWLQKNRFIIFNNP